MTPYRDRLLKKLSLCPSTNTAGSLWIDHKWLLTVCCDFYGTQNSSEGSFLTWSIPAVLELTSDFFYHPIYLAWKLFIYHSSRSFPPPFQAFTQPNEQPLSLGNFVSSHCCTDNRYKVQQAREFSILLRVSIPSVPVGNLAELRYYRSGTDPRFVLIHWLRRFMNLDRSRLNLLSGGLGVFFKLLIRMNDGSDLTWGLWLSESLLAQGWVLKVKLLPLFLKKGR